MIRCKYVIIGEAFPILFYGTFEHKDFKNMGKITSAGFCKVYEDGSVICSGRSESLNIGVGELDVRLITKMLFEEG